MKIVIHILSGFLGSGKTTFLRKILFSNIPSDIAVLVNEFGEIGIDHITLKEVTQDIVLLPNGCICCNINEDLNSSLIELYDKRSRGDIGKFKVVIIELTGLANPASIMSTLFHSHVLVNNFILGSVITIVDGICAISQQKEEPQWEYQVLAANFLLISKSSLIKKNELKNLESELKILNPLAQVDLTENFNFNIFELLTHNLDLKLLDHKEHANKNHINNIETCTIKIRNDIKWEVFSVWLSLFLTRYGNNILRFKALISICDSTHKNKTILLNGVQKIIYPPEHLNIHFQDRYIVFITKNLKADLIIQSFNIFCNSDSVIE